jgi:hypothetical protein
MRLLTNERRFLWIHLVLQILLDECHTPFEVEEAVERLPPGLEAIYSRCLARKRADRLLYDMNLLLWVCAAPEPPGIDALRELLAMDSETGQVSTGDMRTETYLLQSGVGLVTLGIAKELVLFFFFFFSIILYSSCIAYDKPSYLLDDFSGFPLCSRVDPFPYNPARYPDFEQAAIAFGLWALLHSCRCDMGTCPSCTLYCARLCLLQFSASTIRIDVDRAPLQRVMAVLYQCWAMERAHVSIGTGITLSVTNRARNFFGGGDTTEASKNCHAAARDTKILAIIDATERWPKSS